MLRRLGRFIQESGHADGELSRLMLIDQGTKEGVGGEFALDGGGCSVAGEDGVIGRQGDEPAKGLFHDGFIAAGEVGATDGAHEDKVAGEDAFVGGHNEADGSGAVAGGVIDIEFEVPYTDAGADGEMVVGGVVFKFEAGPVGTAETGTFEHGGVNFMDIDGGIGVSTKSGIAGDVIDMAVGVYYGLDVEVFVFDGGVNLVGDATGIYDDGVACCVGQDIAVGIEGGNYEGVYG